MNKTVVFLGILLSLLLLGPYLGIHVFGKPVVLDMPSKSEQMRGPVKVEDLDLMEPVDPSEARDEDK